MKRRFEVDIVLGGKRYFLRESSSDFVARPKSQNGMDRHITVVMDPEAELLKNVHTKSGRAGKVQEDWRLHPDRIRLELSKWIRNNSVSLNASQIQAIDISSYVLSARRLLVSYHVIHGIADKIFWALFRLFRVVPFQIIETEKETRVRFVVDSEQLAVRLRPFKVLARPFKFVDPAIMPGC